MTAGYCYLWEYLVRSGHEADFRRLYGPDGAWVDLFRQADGYLRTELLSDRDRGDRFVTVDYWRSAGDHAAFRERFASAFAALDREGDRLTIRETFIGSFAPAGTDREA